MNLLRKQLYIEERHQAALSRLARARRVTEAELIREALDRQLVDIAAAPPPPSSTAWKEARQLMERQRARGRTAPAARKWKRADLYAERLDRLGRRAD